MYMEYKCLSIMTILFLFAWLPVSIGKYYSFGGKWLLSNRNPLPGQELLPWAARCERAYNNLKDYYPAFIVAILLLGQMNKFDQDTKLAALIFVAGRIGHYISYGIGNVTGRVIFYVASLSSVTFLLLKTLI